jgi:hypothetical protein
MLYYSQPEAEIKGGGEHLEQGPGICAPWIHGRRERLRLFLGLKYREGLLFHLAIT